MSKLLIFTQKIDSDDPVLGFFHEWVDRLSYHFEDISVICIQQGKSTLPKNVKVYPIGKAHGIKKLKYIFGVYKYLLLLNGKYDKVFIHMNQEYVFSLGLYWKLKGVPLYLWRNHPKGNFLTKIAVFLSTKVFCTSKSSYTAKFKKTVIMPAGINTDLFKIKTGATRKKYSICMVGRISPVKHVDKGLKVVKDLVDSGVQVSLRIIGPVLARDEKYFNSLKKYIEENKLSSFVSFLPPVPPENLSDLYNEYQICLNLTDTGSFDKTIVEAASCGVVPLVSNKSMEGILPEACVTKEDKDSIKESIKKLLDDHTRISLEKDLSSFVQSQGLNNLITKLLAEIK